jgi:hypothetical protein
LNILYCAEAGSTARHNTAEAARQARVMKAVMTVSSWFDY